MLIIYITSFFTKFFIFLQIFLLKRLTFEKVQIIVIQSNKIQLEYMKPKLTKEQKFLIWKLSKQEFSQWTLKIYIQRVKSGKMTIDALNPLERQFYDIFTTENATERFAKFQEAYDLMQKELKDI